ncbi:MAG: hypothetical protein IPM79_22620 [Polyangiaceae bacterium]|nr:hypothetical protein [Polyangiaceae bacterium]MBK8940329.1 hypothetical protein [Polyangiaceae bacterium]
MDRRTFLFQLGPAGVALAIGCGDSRGQLAATSGSASATASPLASSAPATAPSALLEPHQHVDPGYGGCTG